MTDLRQHLSRLGLAQYTEKFIEEGFETWDTILDVTESDLDALGVKLGHRRVLQREIAYTRGISVEHWSSTSKIGSTEEAHYGVEDNKLDGNAGTGVGGKRKYRRHPKADENAPERPPSAYVIFSNKIREELKPENLSFTAIAKRVGERWQELPAEEKEPYESEASSAKERFHAEMAEYKTTKAFREYQQYLLEFKAKNASNPDGKRPKVASEGSLTSSASIGSGLDSLETLSGSTVSRRRRVDSMSSGGGQYSTTSGLPSPTSAESGLPAIAENMSSIVPQGNASPLSASPSISSMRRSSPNGPLFLGTAQSRPFIENHFAQSRPSIENHFGSIAPSGLGPHLLRFSPQNRENLTSHDHETEPGDNSRLPEAPISPLDARRNARISTLPRDNMSDSSKSSIISTLSSSSTAASSCGLPMTVDGDKKAVVSLPPLATFGLNLSSGPAYEEKSGRPTLQPLASRGAPSKPNHSSQSPFNSAASTGMKFESLQLPLPYNISFGQHPVPRPDHEGELANISDLQDISLERHPHRNLTHEQERKGAASTTPRAPPEPWHPPHQPTLPSLPPITRDASQKSIFQNANPLSVLAYAGRLVERECDSRLRRP